MDKSKIKYLVGIYAAAMCIMGMLVPVPIVASVAAAFPNENIAAVQMIIGIIPLMMALSAMLVSSQLASRVSMKKTTLVGHVIVMLAGVSVLVFHDSLGQVLAASAVMGLVSAPCRIQRTLLSRITLAESSVRLSWASTPPLLLLAALSGPWCPVFWVPPNGFIAMRRTSS